MNELNLSVGDKVLYYGGYSYNEWERIATVTKITPTGRIRIDCSDKQFDKFGNEMGRYDRWSPTGRIKKLTDEDERRIIEKQTVSKCLKMMSKLNSENFSFEKAEKILSILESEDLK